jgi:hypothetical protein
MASSAEVLQRALALGCPVSAALVAAALNKGVAMSASSGDTQQGQGQQQQRERLRWCAQQMSLLLGEGAVATKTRFGRAGACEAAVAAMRISSSNGSSSSRQALWAHILWLLAHGHAANRARLLAAGACGVLAAALRHHGRGDTATQQGNGTQQGCTAAVVQLLFEGATNVQLQQYLTTLGTCEAVVALMCANGGNADIQEQCLGGPHVCQRRQR